MLATFCLRLACGLAGALLVLSPAQVAPRFYRVQFLTILGLIAAAGFLLWQSADFVLLGVLAGALFLAFLSSVTWLLEGSPGGLVLVGLTALALAIALVLNVRPTTAESVVWTAGAEDASSAALLGFATSAMLMGHSYLIAPAMSIVPLVRLLIGLMAAILARGLVAGLELGLASGPAVAASDAFLWQPVRWVLGFLGPLILTWMAWQCAKIRSTQSATGILYVVVILVFIGELTGQLLR